MKTTEATNARYRFNEQESTALNYAKAIGIITVVIGHFRGVPFNYFQPYMYHMPLFFFLGGVFINEFRSIYQHSVGLVKKHALYIVYVYALIGAIIWFIHLFYPIDYTPLWRGGLVESIFYPIESNFHGGSYFVVAWFLFAYLLGSLITLPVIKASNKFTSSKRMANVLVFAVAMAAAYVGMEILSPAYRESEVFYLNIASQVSVASSFILLGYLARPYLFKMTNLYGFVLLFCSLYILKEYDLSASMGMVWSVYRVDWFVHLITASIGIYAVLFIAKVLATQEEMPLFELVGIHSKSVMSFHILVFVFIDVVFFELGLYDIAETKVLTHYVSGYSWPIYMIAGTLVPVMAIVWWNRLWQWTRSRVNEGLSLKMVYV